MSDEDMIDYLEDFDYALEWDEPVMGHISGRVWEALLPDDQGMYVVKRFHGTTVQCFYEPGPNSMMPTSRSELISYWIEGADHYKKDDAHGWVKSDEAEHLCRLWGEMHAMDNKLIPDIRKKEDKPAVDPEDLQDAIANLRAKGIIP